MPRPHTFKHTALAVFLAIAVAGCGKSGKKADTEAAARVGGDRITVEQVNFQLARVANIKPEQEKTAGEQVLKALVDQQLLVRRAGETGLDREPQIVLALDNARRQILSTAYLEQLARNLAKPTDAEIADYYEKNPALFANRKIYEIKEIAITGAAGQMDAIRAEFANAKSLQALTDWLKLKNIPFRSGAGMRKAEELPPELLTRIAVMLEGQTTALNAGGGLAVVQLLGAQLQPVSLDQGRPAIERFLSRQKQDEAQAAELDRLRGAVKIEYLGAFADLGKAPVAAQQMPHSAPDVAAPGVIEKDAVIQK